MSFTPVPPRASAFGDPANPKIFSILWWGWFDKLGSLFRSGYTGTITTAKLTAGGSNGSMTFQNGVLVSQIQAT